MSPARAVAAVAVLAAAALSAACPAQNTPQPMPPPPAPVAGWTPPVTAAEPPAAPAAPADAGAPAVAGDAGADDAPVDDVVAAPGIEGAACVTGADCQSHTCEGVGCGDAPRGRCAPTRRACTRDLKVYCGCDGITFRASGSCPGRRFASVGACAEP
ncbi:MAG: hypothetical protein H6709_03070 [Kofleriaceae bacterium]|nr:hypothetical protein [Kofleriaceae bacterium]MCB9571050.1 hypothetical protein [Kofleriaceae bacterium]